MNIWFNFVQWNIGPVISSKLFFLFSRVIYMVITSLHSIWIYTVYCFCRGNFITFFFSLRTLLHSLIFRNQVFYITPISYSMQAEIRPMRAVNANWNNIISIVNLLIFSHSFTDIISYQMAFYSTSSTVQKLIMAMISFPRNLYVNITLPCYSGICPPQTCTVRPWSTGSLVDNAEWPPDPEHTRCTCYREICVGNTPHSDLVCTGNQDLWKSNIIISDRKHFRFQRFHFN